MNLEKITCGGRAYLVPEAVANELLALRRLEQDVRLMGLAQPASTMDNVNRLVLGACLLLIDRARKAK